MTRISSVFLCAAMALATLAAASSSGVARAQDAPPDPAQEARQQYQAGTQAYQARRFVEAALHFEAAVAQRPHAVALYTAALAWEQANRPERAADDFGRALDVPGLSPPQAQNARERVSILERTMGTLDVTAPDGWRVQLDANTQVPAPAHLHAMPGVHALTAQPPPGADRAAPSGPIQHMDVALEPGKIAHLALTPDAPTPPEPTPAPPVKEPPAERPMPAPPSAPPDLRRLVGAGVVGAGAASLAAGAILGVSAVSAKGAYDAAPSRAGFNHASSLQTWTTAAFVAGGALVIGGAALVLWPSPRRHDGAPGEPAVSLVPTPGGAVLRGVF